MNTATSNDAAPDPKQKKRLVQGVLVFIAGWVLAFLLLPVLNGLDMAETLRTSLKGIILVVIPKLFLLIAIAIMGKPGFAYLKSMVRGHLGRLAPAATVSPMRYRVGLILFVTTIVLSSLGDYIGQSLPMRQDYPHALAAMGDLLLLLSLFILGGDFWDKLRALFVRDAKVVFPGE